MKFKAEPLVIDANDPFASDALKRKASVEALTNFVSNLTGPFVLAIDAPWGTGKTTFVKMWQAHLASKRVASLYFNSWQSDFSTDPLVAFVAEISDLMEKTQKEKGSYKPHLAKARKLATALAKRALPTALRLGSAGLIDLDELSEEVIGDAAATGISDAIDLYTAEKSLMEQFHERLNATIQTLEESGHHPTLIVFIDELDRCRPTYAIELLERVKHLFNIENVIFVIALDKEQLSVSLQGVYGEGLNTSEYLRRFIDIEFNLPIADSNSFTNYLVSKFAFKEYFEQRQGDLRYDLNHFIETFNSLSKIFDLSLRAREQCFTKIALALNSTPHDYHLYPELLTTLTILSIKDNVTYRNFVFGSGVPANVLSSIRSRDGGDAFLQTREGMFIEAYLILSKLDSHYDTNAELDAYEAQKEVTSNAKDMLDLISHLRRRYRRINLQYLSNKIELAGQLVS
ncbi:MAG: P-loop NTPase fold protein [Methylotenera sp.]|uniref:KAP family P-loop NTPase fold protein n=1 Tax=Methylotenera sp. TaxID=2051956 RepID=UPI0027201B27|nr:P-loop NTPase fold protein [Methylotenera sp.]MDO9149833.1 P-loop NTPase fold protein [Methylotenera sp.]